DPPPAAAQIVLRREGGHHPVRILDQTVPLPAIDALAGPARAHRAAELADVALLRFRHAACVTEHDGNIQRKITYWNAPPCAALFPRDSKRGGMMFIQIHTDNQIVSDADANARLEQKVR